MKYCDVKLFATKQIQCNCDSVDKAKSLMALS